MTFKGTTEEARDCVHRFANILLQLDNEWRDVADLLRFCSESGLLTAPLDEPLAVEDAIKDVRQIAATAFDAALMLTNACLPPSEQYKWKAVQDKVNRALASNPLLVRSR